MRIKYLFLLLFFTPGCLVYDPPDGLIEVKNNSNNTIYVYTACTDTVAVGTKLELLWRYTIDTNGKKMHNLSYPNYRIEPNKKGVIFAGGSRRNPKIYCEEGSMFFFYIIEDTLKNYSLKEIVDQKLYAKKERYSQKELEDMNWQIKFESN